MHLANNIGNKNIVGTNNTNNEHTCPANFTTLIFSNGDDTTVAMMTGMMTMKENKMQLTFPANFSPRSSPSTPC